MSSVGKKLAQNITKGTRNLSNLKTGFPIIRKPAGHSRDDLDDVGSHKLRKTSHDTLSANISVGTPLYKTSKSNSMGSVHSESPDSPMDHEQIVQLTRYVRSLSEGLQNLKAVFCHSECEISAEDLRVAAHERLGEVLGILKEILQKYPALHTTDVLTTAAMLITKIKSSHYEDVSHDAGNLLYMIDQLSLAFSTSVSDYLMGDIDNFPTIGKTKSYDNLASDAALEESGGSPEKPAHHGVDADIDGVLQHLEGHGGVDRALHQAKLWAKYVKEIITYVEKKNALENEYSKSLAKLANSLKNAVMKETYLPMQAIFCTTFDQDMDFCAASQATGTIVQTQKFVEPLSSRRAEHEKVRKHLKDTWAKELKRMNEAVSNLHKARTNYVNRVLDQEKAKEAAQKADAECQAQNTAALVTKLEKKRKLDEEAQHKAIEAVTTYKACVADANHRQQALEKVKCKVLAEVRDLIFQSDQVMKHVTVAYFQLLHTLSAPKPVQFQALCEASQQFDPGSQYVEYVKRMHVRPDQFTTPEPFVFVTYTPESKVHDLRKVINFDLHSHSHTDESAFDGKGASLKVHGDEDTDSVSDGSSRSQESSPTASPHQKHRHPPLALSHSLNRLGDGDSKFDPRQAVVSEQVRMTFRGVELSPAAQTHMFKKLRILSKCRECESYVYFQGAECERCGLSSHKKCLESLHWECGHKSVNRRMTTFGVDFSEHVQETHTDIPRLVWKCTEEIDERGLDVKGIYRVSGVKSKVESLCQGFEMDESNVDLSDHHPNVIANVLKLYLRQLPEPLMSFRLYPEFVRLAKEEQQSGTEKGPAGPEVLQTLTALVQHLPKPHFRTCGHLMHHLRRVTETQETNQMNAYNLGVVFGPTLLRQSEDAVSLDSLLDTPCQTRIVELLIMNVETIFGSEEQFTPLQDKDKDKDQSGSEVKPDEPDGSSKPGSSEATKSPAEPLKLSRPVPEITRELVPSRTPEPISPPTLLEMAGNTPPLTRPGESPRGSPQPPSPVPLTTPDIFGPCYTDENLFETMLPEYLASSKPDSQGNTPDKELSPSGNNWQKKILPSQLVRSRDSSPTDHSKPMLTKPRSFTPPVHRRLCKTGTGGLLERPTTPDPLPDESDTDSEGLPDVCYSLPLTRASISHTPVTVSQSLPPTEAETSVGQSVFYTDYGISRRKSNLNQSNNKLAHSASDNVIYRLPDSEARSIFYAPSPRLIVPGENGDTNDVETKSEGDEIPFSSPSPNKQVLVPKNLKRKPKYV